ncbi:MAG: 16S rRNA (guanine(966)-N(2))-methyltransferase RsmD [Rhodobacteraceae bacterium GWE1_64_9]|nr:MAG: 16S rRNA (guanine(966)-N(2))-methyltransferase RsmD [Rhodobacteraceae bacterium GWE1_64_9]OHC49331.1 MAG: 16S rRNA (guanine(966)-N(2))-methyltransferase RsmD [Rhodobacteraceae bacterium GWF1_65_7]HBD91419.1 16S rRNA (guanine(966)-N(2))-methyltransferase RsmD [Gemmobacter sp.]HBU16623.1 16S rRNA (guanine(966)-N(2))-methyltransferase RsmD [Gemmobacter sp.]
MRIIGGSARGLKLADVGAGDPAAHLRPTSDRVREAIFNLLVNGRVAQTGDPLTGARVLDLFAGTGALGLEALSRGAAQVAFVDDGTAARALLRRNIELMRAMGSTDVWRRDATAMGLNRGPGYGLVFLDPPYGKGLGEKALASCLAGGWLAPGALVVWEESSAPVPPAGFTEIDQRKYGETFITLLRLA